MNSAQYQPTHYTRTRWQRVVLYLYALCCSCYWLRPAYKRLLHLLTGRCEIERVCACSARYNRTLLLGASYDLRRRSRVEANII